MTSNRFGRKLIILCLGSGGSRSSLIPSDPSHGPPIYTDAHLFHGALTLIENPCSCVAYNKRGDYTGIPLRFAAHKSFPYSNRTGFLLYGELYLGMIIAQAEDGFIGRTGHSRNN